MVRVEVEDCETEEEVEIETDTGVFSDEQIAYLTPIVKERFGKDIDFKKITSEDVDFLEYNLTDEEKGMFVIYPVISRKVHFLKILSRI